MLNLKKVTGGYHGVPVVRDISMQFMPGALNIIIGPNGCGKSTIMRIAAGQLPPQSGEVHLDGEAFSMIKRQDLARRIAYLPQSQNIPDIAVQNLVMHGRFPHLSYPRRYRKEDIAITKQVLEQLGIANLAEKQMNTLSGGERQKAYIAMLLAQNGDIIFMDEPTAYLDISHQLEIMEILNSLKERGKTLVVILHDLNLAMRYADRVFLMNAGDLIYDGSIDGLFNCGLLDDVFTVKTQRVETEMGPQYYFIPKEHL